VRSERGRGTAVGAMGVGHGGRGESSRGSGGQRIALGQHGCERLDGAQAQAMGGNFYQLRDWSDADWKAARDAIVAQNEKDKAKRT